MKYTYVYTPHGVWRFENWVTCIGCRLIQTCQLHLWYKNPLYVPFNICLDPPPIDISHVLWYYALSLRTLSHMLGLSKMESSEYRQHWYDTEQDVCDNLRQLFWYLLRLTRYLILAYCILSLTNWWSINVSCHSNSLAWYWLSKTKM